MVTIMSLLVYLESEKQYNSKYLHLGTAMSCLFYTIYFYTFYVHGLVALEFSNQFLY